MKSTRYSLALLAGLLATSAYGQEVVYPPQGGIPINNGARYANGTIFVNGMAYPSQTRFHTDPIVGIPIGTYNFPRHSAFTQYYGGQGNGLNYNQSNYYYYPYGNNWNGYRFNGRRW